MFIRQAVDTVSRAIGIWLWLKCRDQVGRGLMQGWDNGAQVRDELPSADHRYREELIEIHRRDEAENGTAPRPSCWASATAAPGCD
jgi:hypothetical protein